MVWPVNSGRMFLSFINSQHITTPPIAVSGTSTGLGQWSAPKSKPPIAAAEFESFIPPSRRFMVMDCKATCCKTQNAK